MRRLVVGVMFALAVLVAIPAGWMPTVVEVTLGDGGVGVQYNQTAVDEIMGQKEGGSAPASTETPELTPEEPTATTATPEVDREERAEQVIHERVNAVRKDHGRDRLGYSSMLAEIAEAHSEDMAKRDYFDHTNPDGLDAGDRYDRHGVGCAAGENIFRYSATWITPEELAESAVSNWMKSPGHRENVLRSRFDREGIGVSYGESWVYVTQNFC